MSVAIRISAMLCLILAPQAPCLAQEEPPFTEEFRFQDCTFSDSGRNAFFSLQPGDRSTFEGEDDEGTLVLEVTVLTQRRWVVFETAEGRTHWVLTRVVEEREWLDDELIEVSHNFFARCVQTGAIYYFGEDVDIYEDGTIVNHEGAWVAGMDGALPGLFMPGTFLLGARYFQELAPEVALDRAEHVAMGLTIEVPAGIFEGCVEVAETNLLEPGAEDSKIYCPDVGLVIDGDAELVAYRTVRRPGLRR